MYGNYHKDKNHSRLKCY